MMFLLDTNALIILLHDELTKARLETDTKSIIVAEEKIYVSIVSFGKLQ